MNNHKPPYRTLSAAGEKEVGHIFKGGVPVKQITPVKVELADQDGSELVFLIDWDRLTDAQQEQCIEYLTEKFDASPAEIKAYIAAMGYFPIRHKFVIESYDMRMLI